MSCAHGCDGTGRLGSHLEVPCPCSRENADEALARVTDERNQLAIANAELGKVVVELELERAVLQEQVRTLRGHRLKLIDALTAEAAALQAAHSYERAKALMALVRQVADA